ncbi:MAG: YtxH domain-containing protein [Acidobacteria bacterium]|nr:YtxH domain-containing protein [Acidobacteriota bacterium]
MEEDKRLSYFCLGLGIGVAVGILFAPKSGEETRALLRDKADESKDYLIRKSSELKETSAEILDRSKLALQKQKEQLAAAVDAGRQAYKETLTAKAGEAAG